MRNPEVRSLPVAVRVFPAPAAVDGDGRSGKFWRDPEGILVLHTVVRRNGPQKLLIGFYRVIIAGQCVEEGMFYGDDLSKAGIRILKAYLQRYRAETVAGGLKQINVLTRREFLQLFYELAYKARCLVVGFNLPVHLSRLAYNSAPARGFFAGGFSLGLWSYIDKRGRERPNGFRPRICVKYVDRKRALIGFTARNSPDQEDLIPEGSLSGEPRPGYRFPGHFLDARTLAFALADELYSLETACKAFGPDHG